MNNNKDSLGDRMKSYEKVNEYKLTKRSNVIIRIDGKAFHTFTRHCDKPFDARLIYSLVEAMKLTSKEIQGFKLGYHQSDEMSFLLQDFNTFETDAWFDNKIQKIASVSASLFTGYFNQIYKSKKLAFFDARVFVVPPEDVANYFLWRCQDWERNSLQMYCRSFFSDKEMQHKNRKKMHEMLHKIGKNWTTDLVSQARNGTFIDRSSEEFYLPANYTDINNLLTIL